MRPVRALSGANSEVLKVLLAVSTSPRARSIVRNRPTEPLSATVRIAM